MLQQIQSTFNELVNANYNIGLCLKKCPRNIVFLSILVSLFLLGTLIIFAPNIFIIIILSILAYFFGSRKGRKIVWTLVPVTAITFGFILASITMLNVIEDNIDYENMQFRYSTDQDFIISSWFYSGNLNATNTAGRKGVTMGSFFGLGLGVCLCFFKPKRRWRQNGPSSVRGRETIEDGWATKKELARVCSFGPIKQYDAGIIIGKLEDGDPDSIIRMIPGKNGMAGHTITRGGSGSGKTFGFVLPNIVSAALEQTSMVINDPKDELVRGKFVKNGDRLEHIPGIASWLKEKMGYNVIVFNLKNPFMGSHKWNPLTEAKDEVDLRQICEAMIYSTGKDSPFFTMGEINLFTALVGLVKYTMPLELCHLRTVLSILAWPKNEIDKAFNIAYSNKSLPFYFFEKWQMSKVLYENFMAGVANKVEVVTQGPLAGVLSGNDFDLTSIGNEKTAVFVILPQMGDLRPVLTAFYYMLFKRLIEHAENNYGFLPTPVRFILDEFASIGMIPGFEKRISFDRGFGITYILICQALTQLKSLYGANDTQTILSNCDIQIALRGNDEESNEYFAQKLGQALVKEVSERRSVTYPTDRLRIPQRVENTKEIDLLKPWHLRELPLYEGIGLVPTCRPTYIKMISFSEMPEYNEIPKEPKTIGDFAPMVPREVPIPPVPGIMKTEDSSNKKTKCLTRNRDKETFCDDTAAKELGFDEDDDIDEEGEKE